MPDPTADPVLAIAAIALLAVYLVEWLDDTGWFDEDPIDAAQQAYANDEITLSELERRVAYHADDRNDRIEALATRVAGIGPTHAAAVAQTFDSVADLETASLEELRSVPGIGEQRGAALHTYLHGDTAGEEAAAAAAPADTDQEQDQEGANA